MVPEANEIVYLTEDSWIKLRDCSFNLVRSSFWKASHFDYALLTPGANSSDPIRLSVKLPAGLALRRDDNVYFNPEEYYRLTMPDHYIYWDKQDSFYQKYIYALSPAEKAVDRTVMSMIVDVSILKDLKLESKSTKTIKSLSRFGYI